MAANSYDCIVIGAGPGGYVAAIRAAQLGLKTAVIEKESPGGVCLNWGCIPSKALLKSAKLYQSINHAADFGIKVENVSFDFGAVVDRSRRVVTKITKGVEFLLKKNKVDLIMGHAKFKPGNFVTITKADGKEEALGFKKAIIATGGRARSLPNLKVDEERIFTYRQALALKTLPSKLLVVGAGAIGMEFAYYFSSFGTDVTVVEMLDSVLPVEDKEISQVVEKSFVKKGVKVKTKTMVDSLERKGEVVSALLKTGDKAEQWSGDYCLVAIGFQGNVENLGLEEIGLRPERGFLEVDQFFRTSVANIYAIGDVIGAPLLAHVASHEGVIAAEHLAGHETHPFEYHNVPACTFCQPEVASIGLTEEAAKAAGYKIKVGRFPFAASGRAVAANEPEGLVKVIIDEKLEEVLGIHIVHTEASELAGEAAIIRSHEGTASSVLATIHAHPTLSEAIMEAMGDALGRAIHI